MSAETEESSEHFFTSFTDLLVGVIFLFVILLMVFAVQLKNAPKPVMTTEQARAGILSDIAQRMEKQGMKVEVDFKNGVIRLPASLLFESGQWELSEGGQQAIDALAGTLQEVLPCATESTVPCNGEKQPIQVDSVLIEGHTDNRPFIGPNGIGNWELSAFRAITVYKAMVVASPDLGATILNAQYQPILGVSAYGDTRPVDLTQLDPNRRIDVRFTMRANRLEGELMPEGTMTPAVEEPAK